MSVRVPFIPGDIGGDKDMKWRPVSKSTLDWHPNRVSVENFEEEVVGDIASEVVEKSNLLSLVAVKPSIPWVTPDVVIVENPCVVVDISSLSGSSSSSKHGDFGRFSVTPLKDCVFVNSLTVADHAGEVLIPALF